MNAREQYAFVDSRYRKYCSDLRERIKAEDAGQPAPAVYTFDMFWVETATIPTRVLFAAMNNHDKPRVYPAITGKFKNRMMIKRLKAKGLVV